MGVGASVCGAVGASRGDGRPGCVRAGCGVVATDRGVGAPDCPGVGAGAGVRRTSAAGFTGAVLTRTRSTPAGGATGVGGMALITTARSCRAAGGRRDTAGPECPSILGRVGGGDAEAATRALSMSGLRTTMMDRATGSERWKASCLTTVTALGKCR